MPTLEFKGKQFVYSHHLGGVRQPSFCILLCRFQGLFRIQPDRTHGFPVAGAA